MHKKTIDGNTMTIYKDMTKVTYVTHDGYTRTFNFGDKELGSHIVMIADNHSVGYRLEGEFRNWVASLIGEHQMPVQDPWALCNTGYGRGIRYANKEVVAKEVQEIQAEIDQARETIRETQREPGYRQVDRDDAWDKIEELSIKLDVLTDTRE